MNRKVFKLHLANLTFLQRHKIKCYYEEDYDDDDDDDDYHVIKKLMM